MAHYSSSEELPDPDDIEDGDTVEVGGTEFQVSVGNEWDLNQLRTVISSARRALNEALDAFDRYTKTDSEKVNVVANVLFTMHEWSHLNAQALQPWIVEAAERDTVREAEGILKGAEK